MTMDFTDRVIAHLNGLSLPFRTFAYANATGESIAVSSMPGGRTIQEYYDGIKDKRFTYFVQVKVNADKTQQAEQVLQRIASELDDLEDLPSLNSSYDFIDIIITNEPYHFQRTDAGDIYFRMSFQAELTIY